MRRLWLLLALSLAASTGQAQEAMSVQTVQLLKEATAFIRTEVDFEAGGSSMSGTGFLIRKEGTTGYVVTSSHVVTPELTEESSVRRPATQVYFRSGTKSETMAVAEIVANSPERDLALLRVTNVANLPKPVDLTSGTEPFETMTVYIFGFPFGEKLAEGKHNPPVNVGRGQVSSVRRGEDDRITSLLLDGALNPGNSGGPVVDTKGKLVGIARATIRGANIGFAIAAAALTPVLSATADAPSLHALPGKGGTAELTVESTLVDPLGQINSVRLLYIQGAAKFAQSLRKTPRDEFGKNEENENAEGRPRSTRKSAPQFVFGPIEGAESVPMKIDQHRASATVPVSPQGKDLVFWYQVAIVNDSGQTVHLRPGRCFLGGRKSPDGPDSGSASWSFWGGVVDPDGDCDFKLAGGALSCVIPGTLHDLNIDINKNNGPRVVQEIEGDFIAQVKVTGSFRPGPLRTGPKSVPYNGGGLLVWLDDSNYIRLERAAMFRNNRVLGFLAFESREHGQRAQVHNKGGLNPEEDLWLRIERHGSVIEGSWSRDGRVWEKMESMVDIRWPGRVLVGVDGVNSCGDSMTLQFHNYSLVKPKT